MLKDQGETPDLNMINMDIETNTSDPDAVREFQQFTVIIKYLEQTIKINLGLN